MNSSFGKLSTEEKTVLVNNLSEKLQELEIVLNKTIDEYKELYPAYLELVDKARRNGWTIPVDWQISLVRYKELAAKEDFELSSLFMLEFSKNDRQLLFNELEHFQSFMPSDYGKEVGKIIQLLKYDFTNYTVVIPTLFSFLDLISTELVFGGLEHGEYMKDSVLKKFQKTNSKILQSDIKAFTSLAFEKLVELLREQVEYRSFEEEPIFNRNFVMHGRFNPSNYTEEMFYKLVLLCSTTAVFVNDEKERGLYQERKQIKDI